MKILYLGTAAYDAIPSPFCGCEICNRSRLLGGRNIRSRSQAIVNGDLLLDFNGDTVSHFLHRLDIDWNKIDNCLITHSHSDHLYAEDIAIPQYSAKPHKVNYFAAQSGYDIISKAFAEAPNILEDGIASVTLVKPLKSFTVGNYKILPLPANHERATSPVIYAIERGGKRLLYAHDTGYFFDETITALKAFGSLDLISFDCTGALKTGWRNGHMSFDTVRELAERLKSEGIITEKTIKVLNHFSHNGNATHDDMVAEAEKYGYEVAYDGMEIQF